MLVLTAEVTTGNVATVNDAYDTTLPNNGARNPLGTEIEIVDSSGRTLRYKYVRLNCTSAPTHWANGTQAYWKDNSFTVVTIVGTEALGTNNQLVAGVVLNTDTKLTNGNYVWIQTKGYLASAIVPSSTAIGDAIVGYQSSGTQSVASVTCTFYATRTAAGTAPVSRVLAWAITAISSGVADILIDLPQ